MLPISVSCAECPFVAHSLAEFGLHMDEAHRPKKAPRVEEVHRQVETPLVEEANRPTVVPLIEEAHRTPENNSSEMPENPQPEEDHQQQPSMTYACIECPFVAIKPRYLKSHMGLAHSRAVTRFECPLSSCGYAGGSEKVVSLHVRSAHGNGNEGQLSKVPAIKTDSGRKSGNANPPPKETIKREEGRIGKGSKYQLRELSLKAEVVPDNQKSIQKNDNNSLLTYTDTVEEGEVKRSARRKGSKRQSKEVMPESTKHNAFANKSVTETIDREEEEVKGDLGVTRACHRRKKNLQAKRKRLSSSNALEKPTEDGNCLQSIPDDIVPKKRARRTSGNNAEETFGNKKAKCRARDSDDNIATCSTDDNINIATYIAEAKPSEDQLKQITKLIGRHEESSKGYVCLKCEHVSSRDDFLQYHVEDKHFGMKRFCCTRCDYKSASKTNLVRHVRVVHIKKKVHGCDRCQYKSASRSNLISHVRNIHAKERNFACQMCDFKSTSSSNLASHEERMHVDEKVFVCRNCDFESANFSIYNSHVKTAHAKANVFRCSHCEFTSTLKSDMDSHIMNTHTEVKVSRCRHCDFKSSFLPSLKTHMLEAHASKCFSCTHCEFRSAFKCHLNQHVSTVHATEKSFGCKRCDFTTAYKANLVAHVRSVHMKTAVMFRCEQCDFKTARRFSLARHLESVHADGNVFKCRHCDFETTDRSILNSHGKSMHARASIFSCRQCKFTSEFKLKLGSHVRSAHSATRKAG